MYIMKNNIVKTLDLRILLKSSNRQYLVFLKWSTLLAHLIKGQNELFVSLCVRPYCQRYHNYDLLMHGKERKCGTCFINIFSDLFIKVEAVVIMIIW
jgi:hypothetical protein